MEGVIIDIEKEEEVDSQCSLSKDAGVGESNLEITEPKLKSWLGRVKAEQILASHAKQQSAAVRCIQGSFLQVQHFLDLRTPKYICFGSLDENRLLRCLDLIELGASNSSSIVYTPAVTCNIAVNLRLSKIAIIVDDSELCGSRTTNTSGSGGFVIQCLSPAGTGQWILGNEGNENVRNILKGPLLGQFGSSPILGIAGSVDAKGKNPSEFMKSPSRVGITSPQKLEKETIPPTSKQYRSEPLHNRLVSISSTNSACSYRSSSSAPATVSLAMLHCAWKSGIPYFEYSVDNQRKVYTAKLLKAESSDYKDPDYVYIFRSKTDSLKECGACDDVSDVVGKMKVSSSFTLCSDNSKILETEFLLFGADAKYSGNMQNSDPTVGKNKRLPKKIMHTCSKKHLFKHQSSTKYDGQNSIPEVLSCDIVSPPNLELAAVIVKERLHDDHQDKVVGGWGLKFLEKGLSERASSSQEASISSGSFQDQSDCSTIMNVLIPAGFHGGPRTKSGGPSGLTERWRSGGHCDCGGWDLGCPLTILYNKSSKEVWTGANSQSECKSFDFVIEGAKQGVAPLKIVNIHDGLYCIHFESSMSALQSFSIGVAIIHTQSPTLRPKNVHKWKL